MRFINNSEALCTQWIGNVAVFTSTCRRRISLENTHTHSHTHTHVITNIVWSSAVVAVVVVVYFLSALKCIATSVWCLLSFDIYLYHTLAHFHGKLSEPRSTYLDLPDRKWKFMSYALKSHNAQLSVISKLWSRNNPTPNGNAHALASTENWSHVKGEEMEHDEKRVRIIHYLFIIRVTFILS